MPDLTAVGQRPSGGCGIVILFRRTIPDLPSPIAAFCCRSCHIRRFRSELPLQSRHSFTEKNVKLSSEGADSLQEKEIFAPFEPRINKGGKER